MKLHLLPTLVLIFSFSAFGQSNSAPSNDLPYYKQDHWFLLLFKPEGSYFAFNPSKVLVDKDFTYAWVKELLINKDDLSSSNSKIHNYNLTKYKINCGLKELTVTQVYKYRNDEKSEDTSFEKYFFVAPPPDSVVDSVIKVACMISALQPEKQN